MRRILLTLLTLAVAVSVAAQSRIEEFRVKSSVLGAEKTCSVYLPDGYDSSSRSYPVLYLLHGAGGCHTDWAKRGFMRRIVDEAVAAGAALPMVVVMPDASGEGERLTGAKMGYFNTPGWNYEDFFFSEFIPAVEKQYRIAGDKKHRAVAGLSMGGGGSAVYALRHPEVFGSACPLSGLLDTLQNPRPYYDPAWVQSAADNSPLRLLEQMADEQLAQLRAVRWWVDCGDDDFLYESNIRFFELMRKREIPLQYRMRDGGHTWRYWQQVLPDVLTFVSTGFAQ